MDWDRFSADVCSFFPLKVIQTIPIFSWIPLSPCSQFTPFRSGQQDRMGQVTVKLSELQVGSIKDDWFRLVPQKTGDPVSGELRLKMQLIDPKAAAKKQAAKQSRTADPLLSAIIQNDVKKLDELMNTKIDVNKVDDHGFSPLHIACNKDAWNEGAVQVVLKYDTT
jgi:hypothetical protein